MLDVFVSAGYFGSVNWVSFKMLRGGAKVLKVLHKGGAKGSMIYKGANRGRGGQPPLKETLMKARTHVLFAPCTQLSICSKIVHRKNE